MKKTIIFKLASISVLIGIISGLGIGSFLYILEKAIKYNLEYKCLLLLLPFSGVLMTFLYKKYGGNSQRGNNLIIDNINGNNEKINFVMAPLVFVGTILTHLFGGSVGREGTGVQIGGTIASVLSNLFKIDKDERKILLISGVAAGFSSVFGTPLAGTIFALEISNVGSVSYNSMLPAITAAIVGDRVVRVIGITHTHYGFPPIESLSIYNFLKIVVLAVAFGLASRTFVFMTHFIKNILEKYFKNPYLKIFVGGSLMIMVTLILKTRLYNNLSMDLLEKAFSGDVPILAFGVKLALTTLCLAAGYQGGEVTPLFVIGATLGSSLSSIVGLPVFVAASLGMIGVFAGATNAPIACFFMYLEVFGVNNIVLAMLVSIISVFISGKNGIYTSQLWIE